MNDWREQARYHRQEARNIRKKLAEGYEQEVSSFLATHAGHDIRKEFSSREFGLHSEGHSELHRFYKLVCRDDEATSKEIAIEYIPPEIRYNTPDVPTDTWF